MTELDTAIGSLREDFAVASFSDGGLLLHLPSGDFFPLDAREAALWDAIARTSPGESCLRAVAGALSIALDDARAVLLGLVARARGLPVGPPTGMPRFWDDDRTLSLRDGAEPLLALDKRSLVVSVNDGLRDRSGEAVAEALRVFVPKVFGRWYPLALHASALAVSHRTVLFCGASGAGKTTTARTLAEEARGGRLVSEDVVLLDGVDGALMMVEGAEIAIQSWLGEATAALVERREPSCDAAVLRRTLEARTGRLPVHKAIFLRADRRRGDRWSLARLTPAAALRGLFMHSFVPSADVTALKRHLGTCRALAGQLDAAEALEIPAGLQALRNSRDQIETIAS